VEHRLRDANADGDLDVHYQPIVDIRSGRIVACEALGRIRHTTVGLVSPTEFIKVAEETWLIIPLGDWVLRRACFDAASWPEEFASQSTRIAALRPRVLALQAETRLALDDQRDHLERVAVAALEAQRDRLNTYMVQARFSLATIYDRAAASVGAGADGVEPGADSVEPGTDVEPVTDAVESGSDGVVAEGRR